jgi:lactate dehydrogenase-like 2-hydroxyacid dehydrogenase
MTVDILKVAKFPPSLDAKLNAAFTMHDMTVATDPDAMVADVASKIRGMCCFGSSVVPGSLISKLAKLEIIAVVGVGYDGVDLAACKERGVILTNTPDVLTDDVADVALALVLNTAREFVKAHNFLVSGAWPKGAMPLASKVGGKTAGILGLGRIGRAIAQRLQACGMKIAYHGRKPQKDVDFQYLPTLKGLAEKSDFLIVACQGGPETKNLVNAEILAALGAKGTVINIARGSVIDEPALISALQHGTIKAAGLDVFANEPVVPEALMQLPNVVLFPHVGSATVETRGAMGNLAYDNLTAHFAGKPVLTRVI